MKLTDAQGKWLLRARAAGYETGFRARLAMSSATQHRPGTGESQRKGLGHA